MPKDEVVEVKCPDCGAVVRIAREEADKKMKAKCPNGHEVPLVKALSPYVGAPPLRRRSCWSPRVDRMIRTCS